MGLVHRIGKGGYEKSKNFFNNRDLLDKPNSHINFKYIKKLMIMK